ncbi:hypothetical protein FUAX_06500 [Fulvitalea axinellae]|uniref:Outer membrane protein beta-barrel domain-containing protein n=1 Tax=Fulvitalea axinellae TaxID=1182444 RepID=A0AAU9CEG6_9BACT|nr:hypothetical protein FUAX_06500 [Fulvitalea axinellae]
MKRFNFQLFVCLIVILSSTTLHAQKKLRFGFKGGVVYSSFYGDHLKNVKAKVGYQAGFLAEYRISEKFAIQPEVIYSLEGVKTDGDVDMDINSHYANIPLMLKYYLTDKINIQAGPQIGFIILGAQKTKREDIDVTGHFKDAKFDFNFGAGYELTEKLSLDLRYTLGVTDAMYSSVYQFGSGIEGEARSSNFQLGMSLMF